MLTGGPRPSRPKHAGFWDPALAAPCTRRICSSARFTRPARSASATDETREHVLSTCLSAPGQASSSFFCGARNNRCSPYPESAQSRRAFPIARRARSRGQRRWPERQNPSRLRQIAVSRSALESRAATSRASGAACRRASAEVRRRDQGSTVIPIACPFSGALSAYTHHLKPLPIANRLPRCRIDLVLGSGAKLWIMIYR
jgi:hypothetical protein